MNLDYIIPAVLNQYIVDKVWNEPISEYRENIRPSLLSPRSHSGNFTGSNGTVLPLPTRNIPYFVYGLSDSDMCIHLSIPSNVWVSAVDICNEHRTLFNMYSFRGHMFHKGQVYLRYNQTRTALYIAVAKPMVHKFLSVEELSEVYFTVYFDSDLLNDITAHSFLIPKSDYDGSYLYSVQQAFNSATNLYQTTMYVNGLECTHPEYVPAIGDYIDLIYDTNIVAAFDIDLTDLNNRQMYYSSKDKTYKQLVHVPKGLNPDNKVITHNTCDFYVRKKDVSGRLPVEGVYLHRCADLTVGQVTHNDMSIPVYIVDAFRDHLGTQNVTIHVKVRIHDKDNVLLRDKSYIDLLYTHDDATIVDFLLGRKLSTHPQLSFWMADELEKTVYLELMFDVYEKIVPANMTKYVEGLGYYHVLALICERIVHTQVTDAFSGSLTFTKPYIYRGRQILPIVYLNGRKIHQQYVSVTYQNDTFIEVTLSDIVTTNVGDTITLAMYLDGNRAIPNFVPNSTTNSFEIPHFDFTIYEKIETFEQGKYKGVDKTSSVRYVDVTNKLGLYSVVTSSMGTMIFFSEDAYLKSYVLLNNTCSYYWNVQLDSLINNGKNAVVDLSRYVMGSSTITAPILNFKNECIYLNGRYLVRDIDYVIHTAKDNLGVSFKQLVIQSFEYFEQSGNQVEIYLNVAEVEDLSHGFVKEDHIYDPTPANLWFPSISLCHVNGYSESNLTDYGTHLRLPTGKYVNGSTFEVQTAIPKIVKDFVNRFHTNTDKARLEILNRYFYGVSPDLSGLLLVPGNHRLYSIFMNTIIRDVIFNDRGIADDPDADRFKNQLEEYFYLKDIDIVQSKGSVPAFIDYYPSYQQYTTTVDKYNIVRRFIELYMPEDSITAGGDYYG